MQDHVSCECRLEATLCYFPWACSSLQFHFVWDTKSAYGKKRTPGWQVSFVECNWMGTWRDGERGLHVPGRLVWGDQVSTHLGTLKERLGTQVLRKPTILRLLQLAWFICYDIVPTIAPEGERIYVDSCCIGGIEQPCVCWIRVSQLPELESSADTISCIALGQLLNFSGLLFSCLKKMRTVAPIS